MDFVFEPMVQYSELTVRFNSRYKVSYIYSCIHSSTQANTPVARNILYSRSLLNAVFDTVNEGMRTNRRGKFADYSH